MITKITPLKLGSSAVVTAGRIVFFVSIMFTLAINFSQNAWADSESELRASEDSGDSTSNISGDTQGRGYTNKSYHASDGTHTYKHPNQPSYTAPFDYGSNQLPAKVIARNERCNCFTFDATKSYEIDGQKLSAMWDFGDGQTSDQAVVQHCYEKSGVYNVTLTVKDSSGKVCDTGVASTKVDANFPAQADAGPAQTGCLNEAVTFNGTGSANGPFTYNWDFGDGEAAQGATVNHSYKQAGKYRVLLTVDDGKGTKCSVAHASTTAHIFQNATVDLQGPRNTCVGRRVAFETQGTGGKFHWNFGDGQTWDGGSSASHTYAKSGSYTVNVTVDDGRGSKCSVATSTANIRVNEPPVAKISDVETCLVSDAVDFDASNSTSSEGDLSYSWNFGDGDTADGMEASHTYKKSGSYRVILTVKDSSDGECGMSSESIVVTVKNRPEAVITIR